MIKVFFDASVLFSALYSTVGASYRLAELVRQNKIVGFLSLTVIEEVEQHLDKFPQPVAIHQFIHDHNFIVRDHIQPEEIVIWKKIVDPTDAHVVAGAVTMEADYLVTLDKKHLDNAAIKQIITTVKIVSPKFCLAQI